MTKLSLNFTQQRNRFVVYDENNNMQYALWETIYSLDETDIYYYTVSLWDGWYDKDMLKSFSTRNQALTWIKENM
jgi:hypothetical protein